MRNPFLSFLLAALLVSCADFTRAQGAAAVSDSIENVSVIGLGVGQMPDYMGSQDGKLVPALAARHQFEGSERYVVLLGTQVQLNVLDDENWRFGPQLTYRAGRDNEVDDPVVASMRSVDDAWEGGVFLQYRLHLSDVRLHQITFTADVGGGSNGAIGGIRALWWQPLSRQWFFNLGAGVQVANDKWMNTYFGVTDPQDVALFPGLAGQPAEAEAGIKGFTVPVGISYFASRHWVFSAAARFESLRGDAADSPVTDLRGDADQWIFGVMASYIF